MHFILFPANDPKINEVLDRVKNIHEKTVQKFVDSNLDKWLNRDVRPGRGSDALDPAFFESKKSRQYKVRPSTGFILKPSAPESTPAPAIATATAPATALESTPTTAPSPPPIPLTHDDDILDELLKEIETKTTQSAPVLATPPNMDDSLFMDLFNYVHNNSNVFELVCVWSRYIFLILTNTVIFVSLFFLIIQDDVDFDEEMKEILENLASGRCLLQHRKINQQHRAAIRASICPHKRDSVPITLSSVTKTVKIANKYD